MKLKADSVPISIRLEIEELLQKWKNGNMASMDYDRAFDLFDIYWNESFEKINRMCHSCIDRVYGTFKIWVTEWTKKQ